MFRGAFDPLPCALGGGDLEGLNAEQHARICADMIAAWRVVPLAVLSINNLGELTAYVSRSGCGVNHPNAPTVSKTGTGAYTVEWENQYETDDGEPHTWFVRGAVANVNEASASSCRASTASSHSLSVRARAISGGAAANVGVNIEVFGEWGPPRTIADYGGSLTKGNSVTQFPAPYAGQIYRDLQSQRGSAFTRGPGTLVHAENLAIARLFAGAGYKLADSLRNNASGPAKSNLEGLEYWAKSLGISRGLSESEGAFRTRLTLHRRLSPGATPEGLEEEVSRLLGDAFVNIEFQHDDQFETPDANTYWPIINEGSPAYDIGGGAWLSPRAQIIINSTQPGGMSDSEYARLMNNDLFELVDRMIPAWCTAQWRDENSVRVIWDGAEVLWDSGLAWDQLFDWNS